MTAPGGDGARAEADHDAGGEDAELDGGVAAPRRRADERGQVGGIEAIPLGLLVLVVATLLAVNAWAVLEAKSAVVGAARAAARAYVEAPDARVAEEAADRAATEAYEGGGRDPSRLRLERVEGRFARCGPVAFEARTRVPAVVVPWLGGWGDGFTVRARHREVVDPYRSGLPGSADCG